MNESSNFLHQISRGSIINRMLLGAAIGFAVISIFVFSVDDPDPSWGEFWRIRPLIITPLAAAFGMLAFFAKDVLRPQSQLTTVLVYVLSTLAFVVALWLGSVLGLAGTLWD